MALTSVGAIFATGSLLLQRIYIPSVDDSEIQKQFVGNGETLILVSQSVYKSGGAAAVQAVVGQPTFSGRCAVVDGTNTVIDTIIADPAVYSDPRGQVIPSDLAQVNDAWTGSTFTRLFAQVSLITGAIVGISAQPIANATATVGNVLTAVGPTALVGQVVLSAAKLAQLNATTVGSNPVP